MDKATSQNNIIMYGTPVCPMVLPMKGLLGQTKVEYEYIDISKDSEARARVREINSGNESVPTFVFPDGSTLTEPSAGEVRKKLSEMGYKVPTTAMILGNAIPIAIGAAILFALLRAFGVLRL